MKVDYTSAEPINLAEFTFRHIDFYVLKVGDEFRHERATWQKDSEDTAKNLKTGEIRHFWPLFAAKLPNILTETAAVENGQFWLILYERIHL